MRMTSRERLIAAMRNQKVDHVPCGPFGTARLGLDTPLIQELIQRTDAFLPAPVKGRARVFHGQGAEEVVTTSDNETITLLKTPKGDLTSRTAHTHEATAMVEYPLKELDDIEKLLSIPYEEPDIDASHYFDMKAKYDDDGLVLCPVSNAVCVPAAWFGPENFCLFWAMNRDRIIELTRIANERACAFVRRCCERGVTDFRIVGGEYVTTQIGPSGMPDLIREPDRKLIDIIHEFNGIAYYHNHGPVMRYLEDFAYIDVDFLDPLEAPPWGDVDLCKAKEIVGDRYCLVGNLDDMEVINKLEPEAVQSLARERLQEAGTRGFILSGTASGTFTEKGVRNFIAMADTAREYDDEHPTGGLPCV